MRKGVLFCSNCLQDDGLRMTVEKIGAKLETPCPKCGSNTGAQIDLDKAEDVVTEFFWTGSFQRSEFGGASRIASNPHHYKAGDVNFPPWLATDADLIQECLKIGLFHYGPPLWRLGEIEPVNAPPAESRWLQVTA